MHKYFVIALCALTGVVMPSITYGQPDIIQLASEANVVTQTNYTDTSVVSEGYIVGLEIMCPSAITANVSVVVLANANFDVEQLIYSNTTMSASDAVYVRVPVDDTGGVQLGIATNGYERMFIVGNKVQLRVNHSGSTNKVVKAKIKLWN